MKITTLIVKIKIPGRRMKTIEAEKKDGWSKKDMHRFIKGIKSGFPNATITTSTISKE